MAKITPQSLEEHLINKEALFLKLWKKGCGACKLSIPAIERLEAEFGPGGLKFYDMSVDEHPEILEITETENIPSFFVFKDGEMKGRQEGFKGFERLKTLVVDSLK